MGDLISRAAAIESLGECPYNWDDWPEEIQAVYDWESHKKALEDLPAVDATPVVRCKDCKYYNTNGWAEGFGWCERNGDGHGSNDSWFCADGERRVDDGKQ